MSARKQGDRALPRPGALHSMGGWSLLSKTSAGTSAGVIHIGFLSSKKTPSPDRKSSPPQEVCGLSVSFCYLRLCRVRSTYRNVLAPSSFFAPACSLWIHSSSPPAVGRQLFRAVIHPDLSRAPRIENPRTRPHPDSVGTRTTSVPHPVQSGVPPAGGTGHT